MEVVVEFALIDELRMICVDGFDFDGNFEYSPVQTIDIEGIPLEFDIFPTATSNILNISGLEEVQNSSVRIVDLQGRVLLEQTLQNYQPLDVAHFPTGQYFITIYQNNQVQTKQFIKL